MIRVCLHGAPGDPKAAYEHTIHAFRELITVSVAVPPSLEQARALGYTATSMFATSKTFRCGLVATVHDLEYRFKFNDGYLYHFEFTGRIDGIESV